VLKVKNAVDSCRITAPDWSRLRVGDELRVKIVETEAVDKLASVFPATLPLKRKKKTLRDGNG
jgi:hypothetical protein